MKAAVIYRDKKGYIFTPLALTEAEFWVSVEPEIRMYFNAGVTNIVSVFREILNTSRDKVKTPVFNRKLTNEQLKRKKKERKNWI